MPDGSVLGVAATRLELTLNGPETELDGVFGFDYTGTGLSSFSITEVPAPGTAGMLAMMMLSVVPRGRRAP